MHPIIVSPSLFVVFLARRCQQQARPSKFRVEDGPGWGHRMLRVSGSASVGNHSAGLSQNADQLIRNSQFSTFFAEVVCVLGVAVVAEAIQRERWRYESCVRAQALTPPSCAWPPRSATPGASGSLRSGCRPWPPRRWMRWGECRSWGSDPRSR